MIILLIETGDIYATFEQVYQRGFPAKHGSLAEVAL